MMRNIFLVAFREFWQRLRTRGFLLTTIGLPLILLVAVGGSTLLGESDEAGAPAVPQLDGDLPAAIGYVDQAELIERIPAPLPADRLVSFPDVASANEALRAGATDMSAPGAIEAYYVIPPDYRQTGEVRRVSVELPLGRPEINLFNEVLLANLFSDTTPAELTRLRNPLQSGQVQFVQLAADAQETTTGNSMLPFLVAMIIILPLFMSGSYLLAGLTAEKSNRVMEILLVSLRPRDLLIGKLLGLGALTLVQYAAWVILGLGALFITGQDLSLVSQATDLSTGEAGLALLYGLGGYALYAGLMAGIGALSPDLESSRSWTFVITLPMLLPLYLWMAITTAPHGQLAVTLSLIPFSSPLAMLMRLVSTTVPVWQIAISLGLLLLTTAGIVWLMARLFRVQTLLSGESFSVGRFWRVLQQA